MKKARFFKTMDHVATLCAGAAVAGVCEYGATVATVAAVALAVVALVLVKTEVGKNV